MDRLEIASRDVNSVEETWRSMLPNLRLGRIEQADFRFAWRSMAGYGATVLEYGITATIDAVVDEPDLLIVADIRGEKVRTVSERADFDPAAPIFTPGDLITQWEGDAVVDAVLLDRAQAQNLARMISGDDRLVLRTRGHAAVSPAHLAYWKSVRTHVVSVLNTSELASELIEKEAFDQMSRATLLAFPTNLLDALEAGTQSRQAPVAVRRTAQFIEDSAGDPVTVVDIAMAANMSVRGIQQAFRRHYDVSPMRYLRQVRLERAHEELVASDPSRTSVAQVAHRWGFTNLGHFATHYRARFAEAPRQSLLR